MRFSQSHFMTPALCGLAGLIAGIAPAAAQSAGANLVQDSSFESASLGNHAAGASLGDGWTSGTGNVFVSGSSTEAYDGVNTVNFGGLTSRSGSLSQNVATTLGQLYTISFYAAGDNPNAMLTATFGADSLFVSPAPDNGVFNGPADYTHFTFSSTATSPLTTLTFSGTKTEKIGILLDDVSVTQAAPVPEASTTVSFGLLLMLGLGGLVAAARRRAL